MLDEVIQARKHVEQQQKKMEQAMEWKLQAQQCAAMRTRVDELTGQLKPLQAQLDEKQLELEQQAAEIESLKARLQKCKSQLRTEIDQLRQSLKQSEARAESCALREGELQVEVERLTGTLSCTEDRARDREHQSAGQIRQLKEQLNRQERTNVDLKAAAELTEDRCFRFAEAARRAGEQNVQQEDQIAQLQAQLDQLQRTSEQQGAANEQQQRTGSSELEAELQQAQRDCGELRGREHRLEEELAKLRLLLAQAHAKLEANNNREALGSQVMDPELDSLSGELMRLHALITDTNKTFSQASSQ